MASVEFTRVGDITPELDTPGMSLSRLEELCKSESEVFNPTEISSFLKSNPSVLDLRDSEGMSMLMHTSYRGNLRLTRMLVEHGASVNTMSRPAYYTPLMFAGIGNHVELCHLLLSSGAKTSLTNSIDKNAAEMASFVGNKDCARVISSFFSEESFLSIASKSMLPAPVCPLLYTVLLELNNIHPVHALIAIRQQPLLLENIPSVVGTLGSICDKTFRDTFEDISFRSHFLACLFRSIQEAQAVDYSNKPCEHLIRKFLRVSLSPEGASLQVGMENHLRQAIRSFPFRDMPLFQQTLACLQTIECSDKLKIDLTSPTLHVISSIIRGPMAGRTSIDPICATCGGQGACLRECASCKSVWYCRKECQKLHWFSHKSACSAKSSPAHSDHEQ